MKYERTAYEKIWNALQVIQHYRILAGGDEEIFIEWRDFYIRRASDPELILNRLKKDGAIEFDENQWRYSGAGEGVNLSVVPDKFDTYFKEIEAKYKELAEDYESAKKAETLVNIGPESTIYKIEFDKTRIIRVNNFAIAKPDFESENEVVFDYIYRNPNRRIQKVEIERALQRTLIKRLHNILSDLGFRADLKKVFFPGVSENGLEFRNPVTRKELDELRINWLSFPKGKRSETELDSD